MDRMRIQLVKKCQLHTRKCPAVLRNITTYSGADIETESSLTSTSTLFEETSTRDFDPLANARARKDQLPPGRYQFRPPRYRRGPLHPHQPPPASDPASREFIPGPFSISRLDETYHSSIASDLMTLSYKHFPPGHEHKTKQNRLRQWTGDSPYFKNRPLRGPRGDSVLRLLSQPITFRNVPRLMRVTVHSMVSEATANSQYLHVAGMALQAITGQKAVAHQARHNVNQWNLRAKQWLSLTCDLYGEDMLHFVAKLVDVVMPKIKDWKGVKGSSGDSGGNITFGLGKEEMALFPEIEINYDSYPAQMIPGCHITIHTSARNDRDARLLLSACGIPFYGKLVN